MRGLRSQEKSLNGRTADDNSVPAMTMAVTVVIASVMVARPDPKSAIHGPNTRANSAADDRADRPGIAFTFMRPFPRSVDEALSLRAERQTSDGKKTAGENEV